MHRYGTTVQCEQALFAWRWPGGFVCPDCGHTGFCTLKGRRLIQCNSCRRQTSVTAGTIFAGSKLALNVWFLAMRLITQAKNGVSSLELSRQLAIPQNSAWLMKHKHMRAMLERDAGRQLNGLVQNAPAGVVGAEATSADSARAAPPDDQLGRYHAGQCKERDPWHLSCDPPQAPAALSGRVQRSLQPALDLASMLARRATAAAHTLPMPYRLLKLAEAHWKQTT